DLAFDVAAATFGMSIDANETAGTALDDLLWHRGRGYATARARHLSTRGAAVSHGARELELTF
ncbi:MAG TPA: hypothetical protein VGG55_04755, partial [Candidatus Acidoferrales bacterium]